MIEDDNGGDEAAYENYIVEVEADEPKDTHC
jgi:hypothetical protein